MMLKRRFRKIVTQGVARVDQAYNTFPVEHVPQNQSRCFMLCNAKSAVYGMYFEYILFPVMRYQGSFALTTAWHRQLKWVDSHYLNDTRKQCSFVLFDSIMNSAVVQR